MGLFDIFKRDRGQGDDEVGDRKVSNLGRKASDKRAQAYDREEAIRGLVDIGTPVAASALLKRFSLKVDPSITDQEEKQLAFESIISIGRGERGKRVSDEGKDAKEISKEPLTEKEVAEVRDAVIAQVRAYCRRAENLTWPLKVMGELLDDERYEEELLGLLGEYDTEYTRNVEPKVNILAALEDVKSDTIREAVEAYLDDVNETVRYHAVQTVFEQGNPASVGPLVSLMKKEESVRIKNKVADGLLAKGWSIPEPLRDDMVAAMGDVYEYRLSDDFTVAKS